MVGLVQLLGIAFQEFVEILGSVQLLEMVWVKLKVRQESAEMAGVAHPSEVASVKEELVWVAEMNGCQVLDHPWVAGFVSLEAPWTILLPRPEKSLFDWDQMISDACSSSSSCFCPILASSTVLGCGSTETCLLRTHSFH
jgi:hypothetical protein